MMSKNQFKNGGKCEQKMLQFITFTEKGDIFPLVPPTSMMV